MGPLLVSAYDEVAQLLTDKRWSVHQAYSSTIDTIFDRVEPAQTFLAGIGKSDDPTHARLRRLLSKWFTPQTVEKWTGLISVIIDDLLSQAKDRSEFDLMRDFALPIPQRLMSEILGVPYADRNKLTTWGLAIINRPIDGGSDASRRVLTEAMEELCAYLDALIADRRDQPGDDLLSSLVQAQEGSDRLNSRELVAICTELISGGHETTSNLIANASILLMQNKTELDRMLADPSLVAGAVEESLRLEPPTMYSHPRLATEPMMLGGEKIERGDIAFGLFAAANRDPARFDDPDRFVIDRPNNQHFSFAFGMHFCLGAALGRIEAAQALMELFGRFPRISMVDQTILWKRHMRMHGPLRLPVRL